MKTHDLKIWPKNFTEVASGRKKAEVRENDRDFKVGDQLLLREWSPLTNEYTSQSLLVKITHILSLTDFNAVMPGYVVLSIDETSGGIN